ncbi:MAG: SDR family oxidoreductase [Polyangiales bacterium]
MSRLAGRTIVITGGSHGIGRAIAAECALEGARVVVGYRRREREAKQVAEEASNGSIAHAVDVRDAESVQRFFIEALETCGTIDGLVTSAAIVSDGWLATLPLAQFDDIVSTNLRGTMLAIRAALRPMMAQKRGSIVALSSIAAEHASPGQAAYAASKGGIQALVRTVASEVASYGIRVNALVPGLIDAGMVKATHPERIRRTLAHVPLGRLGEGREVARPAVFLLSDDASYITGHALSVDGGLGA